MSSTEDNCGSCGSEMTQIPDTDGHVLMKQCERCGHVDGKDDSCTPAEDEILNEIGQICSPGDSCLVCSVNEFGKGDGETGNEMPSYVECECGNTGEKNFTTRCDAYDMQIVMVIECNICHLEMAYPGYAWIKKPRQSSSKTPRSTMGKTGRNAGGKSSSKMPRSTMGKKGRNVGGKDKNGVQALSKMFMDIAEAGLGQRAAKPTVGGTIGTIARLCFDVIGDVCNYKDQYRGGGAQYKGAVVQRVDRAMGELVPVVERNAGELISPRMGGLIGKGVEQVGSLLMAHLSKWLTKR